MAEAAAQGYAGSTGMATASSGSSGDEVQVALSIDGVDLSCSARETSGGWVALLQPAG